MASVTEELAQSELRFALYNSAAPLATSRIPSSIAMHAAAVSASACHAGIALGSSVHSISGTLPPAEITRLRFLTVLAASQLARCCRCC